MTADDFNPDSGTVRVRSAKSGKPQHIVLTQEGRDFVAQLAVGRPGSARLFPRGSGKPWRKSEQQRPLEISSKAARIDPAVNFHALRHTYASRLAMRGVPLAVIAKQLEHADTRMVEKHYVIWRPAVSPRRCARHSARWGSSSPRALLPI